MEENKKKLELFQRKVKQNMSNTSTDYGNWCPQNVCYILLGLIVIISTLSIIPMLLFLKIILWILNGFLILRLLYLFILYRIIARNKGELQEKIWNLMLQKLSWNGKGKVLDIGTGNGYLAIKLAKTNPNTEAWGIDIWSKLWKYSLKMCEKNAKIEGVMERTKFQKASALHLPFNDGEFDAIVSNIVFHEILFVRDKSILFKEALRVLKKGGVFSIQDMIKIEKINAIKERIQEFGVEEVNYFNTLKEIKLPSFAHVEMKNLGIIFGRK